MSASVVEIQQAVATLLEQQLVSTYEGLQVDALLVLTPSPPCIDIAPGDPFSEQISFDDGTEQAFTIRARVSVADHESGQELLLALMDRNGSSVHGAMRSDRTLGGTVDDSTLEGPSGFIPYADPSGSSTGSLLGCEWRLRVVQ